MTSASEVTTPRAAATVVLLRPGPTGLEALLTHRPSTMAFAADVHVFPGGGVDSADADPRLVARSVLDPAAAAAAMGGDLDPEAAIGAHVAAIREAFEEVGILLADHPAGVDLVAARTRLLAHPGAFPDIAEELGLRLRTDRLVPLSRWVTPPSMPRRFDARFFVASLPPAAEISLVGAEVAAHAWYRPRDAIEAMAEGRLAMWLPTSTTLVQLAEATSIEQVRSRMAPRRLGSVGVQSLANGIVRIEMPAGGGIAGQPVNAYLLGTRRCVLVDPGDPTGDALDAAVDAASASGGRIVAVAVTHVDPDHAAGAQAVAERLDVPILAGEGGGRHLPHPVAELRDDERLDHGDLAMRVVATPGPRSDHLAYVIGDGRFVVSGDLDGVRGARSILPPPDRVALAASVARLRGLAPDGRWLPGHPPEA